MGFNILLCLTIIIIYFLTHISKKDPNKNDKAFLLFAFIILFIAVAFRKTYIGNDTLEYIKFFKDCSLNRWNLFGTNIRFETGYIIFNNILGYISTNARFFMIVMSAIFNFSVYKFIKNNSKNFLFSILIYINLLFFYQSMTMMRQFLAISIILLSFNYVKDKKFFKYLAMTLLASCFHISAIISIIIYPIYYLKINRKRILTLSTITIIVSLLLSRIFPIIASLTNRSTYYNNQIGETKLANIILFLIYLTFTLFALLIARKNDKKNNSFYIYILFISTLLYGLSINAAILARIGHYIAIFSIIAIPNMLYLSIKKKRLLYELIIILFLISYSSTIMINRPEWNSAYNYESCIGEWNSSGCKEEE